MDAGFALSLILVGSFFTLWALFLGKHVGRFASEIGRLEHKQSTLEAEEMEANERLAEAKKYNAALEDELADFEREISDLLEKLKRLPPPQVIDVTVLDGPLEHGHGVWIVERSQPAPQDARQPAGANKVYLISSPTPDGAVERLYALDGGEDCDRQVFSLGDWLSRAELMESKRAANDIDRVALAT